MPTNNIYQFAGDVSALVLADGAYQSDYQRTVGNQPGIARADFVNKALRQSTYMSAVLAQFIVDRAAADVMDSNTVASAVTNLITALQLTTGFATGTKTSFFQAAAPTYWTKDTLNNDKALRVVSGAGGGGGGTHDLSTPPSTAHYHTGPNHTHTGPSHTHTGPNHTHTGPNHTHTGTTGTDGVSGPAGEGPGGILMSRIVHYHTFTTAAGGASETAASGTAATGASGTDVTGASGTDVTGTTTPTAFAPKYIDVIICSKD